MQHRSYPIRNSIGLASLVFLLVACEGSSAPTSTTSPGSTVTTATTGVAPEAITTTAAAAIPAPEGPAEGLITFAVTEADGRVRFDLLATDNCVPQPGQPQDLDCVPSSSLLKVSAFPSPGVFFLLGTDASGGVAAVEVTPEEFAAYMAGMVTETDYAVARDPDTNRFLVEFAPVIIGGGAGVATEERIALRVVQLG